MSKKFFTIDEEKRTISADLTKLSGEALQQLQVFTSLGYTFVQKEAKRNSASRKREHYLGNLEKQDREIFELLASDKAKGAYSKAVSFASRIIRMGKLFDSGKATQENLDTFRNAAIDDFVKAKIYSERVFSLAA